MAGQSQRSRALFLALLLPVAAVLTPAFMYVLCPGVLADYLSYSAALFVWPAATLCLSVALLGLLLVLLLRLRRKPRLLAACLVLSAAIHLLTISFFSLWVLSQRICETVREGEKYELSLGLPSLMESLVGQGLREKLLDAGTADSRKFQSERASRLEPSDAMTAKTRPKMPEAGRQAPTDVAIEIGQVPKPEKKVEEQLATLSGKRPEVTTMKIAVLEQIQQQQPEKRAVPKLDDKELELTPSAGPDAAIPGPASRPLEADLKSPARRPIRDAIELAAARPLQRGVEDPIRAAEVAKVLERLGLPVDEGPIGTEPRRSDPPQVPSAEIQLPRPKTQAQEAPGRGIPGPQIPKATAETVSDSLAYSDLKRPESRPVVETGSVADPGGAALAPAQPMSVVGTRMPAAHAKVIGQSTASPRAARREFHAGYAAGRYVAAEPRLGMPGADIKGSTPPLSTKTLIGPQAEMVVRPESVAPMMQERLVAAPGIQPGEQTPVDLSAKAAVAENVVRHTATRPAAGAGADREAARRVAVVRVAKVGRRAAPEAPGGIHPAAKARGAVRGPARTLAGTDIGTHGAAPPPVTLEAAPMSGAAEGRISESLPLAIVAQVAERRKPQADKRTATGLPSLKIIRMAKPGHGPGQASADSASVPEADSAGGATANRTPVRMKLAIAGTGGPAVRIREGISGGGAPPKGDRSLISVEGVSHDGSPTEKAIYRLRTPAIRKQFIEELGGSKATENAVEQALAWLAKTQSDDGRWDVDGFKLLRECGGAGDRTDGDVALSGLSLLAYLGAGYTHAQGRHAKTVRKGLNWLVTGQKSDGDLRRGGQMYGQAMATAALCESYSLTGDKWLLPPAQRAVKFILNAQNPEAVWRYQPRDDSDTSVAGWQILAMRSAEIAGIAVPRQHYRWTGIWLNKVRKGQDGGLYSYKPGHAATPVMTAEGWFCQLFMGRHAKTRGHDESMDYLMDNLPQWAPDIGGVTHLYYWYYATLALYLSGAEKFDAWNKELTAALLKGRAGDGPAAGSWDPVCQLGGRGGRIYSTAVATLCLEVYYRYLPFYKQASSRLTRPAQGRDRLP